jgi:hypothetical protein
MKQFFEIIGIALAGIIGFILMILIVVLVNPFFWVALVVYMIIKITS